MKMFGALLMIVISTSVNAGQDEEITTQIDILENINDPIEIATHNFVQELSMTVETFSTEKHIDDFKIEYETNAKNTECKCSRKRKVCEDGEKAIFRKNRKPCSDGSKPRCPAKRCSRPIATIQEATTEMNLISIEEPFTTEGYIGGTPTDDTDVKNTKCKCPRRRKLCENGEKPVFRKNRLHCSDGSKSRCPAKRCSKPEVSSVEISAPLGIIAVSSSEAPLDTIDTSSLFSTEKHVDPFVTRNPDVENLLLLQLNTESTLGEAILSTSEYSTEKHIDPFPEIASSAEDSIIGEVSHVTTEFSTEKHTELFPEFATLSTEEDRVFPPLFREKLDIDVSTTPQCFQEGIVSCKGVSLDTDLLDTLTEGRVVMLLPGSDFTMELTKPPSISSRSASYHFSLPSGGSATMTVGTGDDRDREPSVFATIHTHAEFMYFLESCGEECTVVFTRDSNYFNSFED